MIDQHLLAVGQTISVGVRVVRIGAALEFLQIGQTVVVRVLEGHRGVVRVEAVCNGPGIRNASVRRPRQNYFYIDDALSPLVDGLDDHRSTAHCSHKAAGTHSCNTRIADVINGPGSGSGDICRRSVGVGSGRTELCGRSY